MRGREATRVSWPMRSACVLQALVCWHQCLSLHRGFLEPTWFCVVLRGGAPMRLAPNLAITIDAYERAAGAYPMGNNFMQTRGA